MGEGLSSAVSQKKPDDDPPGEARATEEQRATEREEEQRVQSAAVLVLVCSYLAWLSSSYVEDIILNIIIVCATYYIGSKTNFQKGPLFGSVSNENGSWYFWLVLVMAVLSATRDIQAFAEDKPHHGSVLTTLFRLFKLIMSGG